MLLYQRDMPRGSRNHCQNYQLAIQCPPEKRPSDEEEEENIHLYTRVQMIDLTFRINRPGDGNKKARVRQIIAESQGMEDMARLARELTKIHHFPEQDCLNALEEYYEKQLEFETALTKIGGPASPRPVAGNKRDFRSIVWYCVSNHHQAKF